MIEQQITYRDKEYELVPSLGVNGDPCKGCSFYEMIICPIGGKCRVGYIAKEKK